MTCIANFYLARREFQASTFEKYYDQTPLLGRIEICVLSFLANILYIFAYFDLPIWFNDDDHTLACKGILWLRDMTAEISAVEYKNLNGFPNLIKIDGERVFNPMTTQWDTKEQVGYLYNFVPKTS